MLKKLLGFACIVEIGTGLAAIATPQIVVELLLGGGVPGVGVALARCFGVAVLALGVACWPSVVFTARASPAWRAMLIYNTLIALYLAYLFVVRNVGGVLLLPAAALHAIVAILLLSTRLKDKA